ncbi:MAG TPA: ABC transporter substrate-binding protein [Geminicoccus sp.]|jgi:trehalose/maltose transport system substrate-binding protein|uniref:ABC transporter substrate-binding protein n=1 Tax=Geminicoccus sp. TaxID=2024832 RepID=UPI002E6CE6D3|nr:ABC transporter substrate-binding protein [Geminicoccus sp.]
MTMLKLAMLTAAVGLLSTGAANAVTISISCGAVGAELEFCRDGAQAWAKQTGNEVEIVSTPNSATERLALYQQLLAAGSGDVDVFQIDVVWPGLLANHFLDLSGDFSADEIGAHFKPIIENNTIDGQLVAMPWFTDAGMLYYRTDLLEKHGAQPPKTWVELSQTAQKIQDAERAAGNDKMWGYVYQAKAYEGLTCNGLEWVDSFGGGQIVDADGKITIDNDQAVAALAWAASTVGTIAPEGVLNYTEEEARGVWQAGNAVFMRNWPYAWSLGQAEDSPIKDKIGVVALPAGEGGKSTGALGGWQLAVSKYSENPKEAVDLVRYLTSPTEQKRRAVEGAYNPTIASLYKDEDVVESAPFMGALYETFTNAVARPSRVTGGKYNQVSAEFFNTTHQVLSKQAQPADALAALAQKLDRLSRGGRW